MSKTSIWSGRIISALMVAFLLFDSFIHTFKLKVATDAFIQLGYSPNVSMPLGIILLVCLILYIIPRTSVLGAILITGYLGGAVATNVRVAAPLFSNILFPVYIGILVWLGLYLRSMAIRQLIPFKK